MITVMINDLITIFGVDHQHALRRRQVRRGWFSKDNFYSKHLSF